MKKFFLIVLSFCFSVLLHAQVLKSVTISAGGLYSSLTSGELATVTNLTLTGTIDARDFKTMRDEMPVLAVIDLSLSTIEAYSGTEGTYLSGYSYIYPQNTIPEYAFYYAWTGFSKTSLTSVVFPSSLTSIPGYAFFNCTGLTSVAIPISVKTIGAAAFSYCGDLVSITTEAPIPLNLFSAPNVFNGVNTTTCKLYVPYQSKALYEVADQWKDFTSITEMQGFRLSTPTVYLPETESEASVTVTADVSWTSSSDQSWLVASPTSYTGNTTLTLTAEANPSVATRIALVTISSPGVVSQTISVTQIGQPKTMEATAGGLFEALTAEELNTITRLVLTGNIDARDFKTMRDNMPILAEIDLNGATVAAYSGEGGTYYNGNNYVYLANTIPDYAFFYPWPGISKVSLTSVVFPSSLISIGEQTFSGCTGLTSITIPSAVTSIGAFVFQGCTGLTSVNFSIPSSLNSIGHQAFRDCTGLTSFNLPSSLTSISSYVFYNCFGLTTVTIPLSVASIGEAAFINCSGLSSITTYAPIPVNLNSSTSVFAGVNTTTCILNVPYQATILYNAANQWKDFASITEMPGFRLSTSTVYLPETESEASVTITADVSWTASSEQSWLVASPTSYSGNTTLTLTAEANPSVATRIALVTISSPGVVSQTIRVTQIGVPKILEATAGNLSTALSTAELNTITRLVLTGNIDARDFKTMRDNMPVLAEINLSGVTVAAYSGEGGTYWQGNNYVYPVNTIPDYAFFYEWTGISKTSLTSVVFPTSLTSFGLEAFYGCIGLTSINIPSAVTSIQSFAFSACTGLLSVNFSIPSSLNSIGYMVFYGCTGLTSINLPSSITSISSYVFYNCFGLTTVTIPLSVNSIGEAAFINCSGLTSITTYSPIPVNLNSSSNVFAGVNTSTCILHVPYQAKVLYTAANQWKDFTTITEMPGFRLSTSTVNLPETESEALVAITADVSWTTSSDQSWLVASPTSYIGNTTLTLTAEANPSVATRIALVTISSPGVVSQTIRVTQIGQPKTLEATAGGLLAALTAEELYTITRLVLTGTINARDFKTMRDNMPVLAEININGATIAAYNGTEGTYPAGWDYLENMVPDYAFWNPSTGISKTGLRSILPPSSLTSIGYAALYGCTGLTSFSIPASVTTIGDAAFAYCGLTSVIIPSSVTSIGNSIFYNCTSLTSVTIPSSVSSIAPWAFYNCTSLYSITIPVASVGIYAFYNCSGLTSIVIPASVTSIGGEAFRGCGNVLSIYSYGNPPIDLNSSNYVFYDTNKSTCKLYVPYGTSSLYATANQWEDFLNIYEIPEAGTIATSQTICYGSAPATLTSASPGLVMTGATLSYRWEYSTDGIVWTSTGGTNATFAPEALTQTTNFHRITVSTLDGFSWESVPTEPVIITVQNLVAAGTIAANQTICFGTVPSPLTSTEAGTGSGTISYEWQNNASGSYVTIADATSAGYSPPSLTATKSYQRRTVSVLNGINCFSSYSTPVTITVQALVTAGTIATNQTICIGTVPSPLTSMEAGTGSGTISYEWQTNASGSYVTIADATSAGYSPPSLTATTSYQRRTVSALNGVNCFSSYTTPVTITVQTSVMAGTIATNQTICYGTVPSPLSSTAAGTGSGTISYEWQTNASGSYVTIAEATSAGYSPPSLTATTSYQRRTVSALNGVKCYSSYTEPVTITVTPTVTIAAFSPATSIRCQGEGTVTTTTTASHNSAAIVYSLDGASLTGGNTINSSTGAVTYAAGWSGATTITASAEGCNGPATTTHVVTTNALPTAFDVTGGGTYCSVSEGYPVGLAGSEVGVNYTLYMDNIAIDPPGTVAGTGAAIDFGNQPTGTFTVKGTNACGTTNMTGPAVIIEKPSPTLNMPIVNSTCSGEDIYFSAFGLLIEVTNIIHFKITKDGVTTTGSKEVESNVDGVATFIGEAYEPGSYTYEITSIEVNGCTSNFEDKITNFDVNSNLPASVSIAAVPSGAICSGTPVTYTATPINGGTPEYQWYKGSTPVGLNSETYTDNGTIAGSITVIMTSTLGCVNSPTATSNAISLTIASPGQWLGITSDWNTESNWCGGVPSSATNIKIPSGVTQPIIGVLTNASCNNIDIAGGTSFTIASNATGTGSLIISGIVSGAGSASVQRYMTTDRWHIVSSPVAGQSIANFLTSNGNVATDDVGARGMMDYDPDLNDWNNYFTNSTLGNLETGKGFSMRTNANSAVTFSGTLNAGTLSTTGMASGLWNCVGNPYTSAIGINTGSSSSSNFLATNASNLDPSYGAIYIWDQPDENNGTWGIYTIISNTPGFGSDAAFDVQQGQAFMVKMNSALTATSVGYTQAMQLHNPGLALKSGNSVWPAIKLEASVSGQTSSTLIAFNNRMTKGLDLTYDAGLLRGGADLVIYSRLVEDNGIPFAIQALPANEFSTLIIPLGVESKTGGEVVFSSKFIDLPADCQVILEDKLSGTFTDLSISDYRTEIEANSSSSDRFLLHTSSLSTGLIDNNADNLSAYAFRNIEIRINGQVSNQAIATLYDVQGRVILVKTLEEGNLNVVRTPNIKTAIYMLSVNDKGKLQRFKIPVKE